ncbi:histidine phosphatase family protein [Tumebacillus flagellatus]|uniref:Alpha-ribazole phosphatase n=1 Tax=Tumebacillus flagellatus TaxID=1157490 RepID=A0A074LMP6_9BACL|nr:histidine phosphatase family protein [Tumebacillus flagellatus]KEO81795.1 hypothetical protein EL26_18305 [Tumebacillus flagellatus]
MDLIFVRHGETEGNARRLYIGRTDLPLNDRGREQIIALRETLAPQLRSVTSATHSPAARTTQTAQLLLPSDVPLQPDPRLAELHFGDWEAKSYAELEAACRDRLWRWYDDPWTVAPPGGETLTELDARLTAWHDSFFQTKKTTRLVVSHGGPIRYWYAKYVLQDPARFSALHLPPGGFLHVRRTDAGWQLMKGDITAP